MTAKKDPSAPIKGVQSLPIKAIKDADSVKGGAINSSAEKDHGTTKPEPADFADLEVER